MDERAEKVIEDSEKLIGRLQALAAFFGADPIFRILIRTQVIQKLFEDTPGLDRDKLALYHLQFTESIVALLQRIHDTNEKAVATRLDEIHFNDSLSRKLTDELQEEIKYAADQQRQVTRINEAIRGLYMNLSDHARQNPFPPEIRSFSTRYAAQYFHDIAAAELDASVQYSLKEEYKNGYGMIDKKLLGQQCSNDFSNVFICGLKAGEDTLEIYKTTVGDTYFLFYPRWNFFNDFDPGRIAHLDLVTPGAAKADTVEELTRKNRELRAGMSKVRTRLSEEVQVLLQDYSARIATLDFLDTTEHEVQANILKAMLNTESL